MGRFNYFRVFELLLATATHPAKLTTCSKATARSWFFGATLYMFRMCSSQTPPLRSSLTSIRKQQLRSENLLWLTLQRMVTLLLWTTFIFRASDMFKKKAITSGGFRCHIRTIRKDRVDPHREDCFRMTKPTKHLAVSALRHFTSAPSRPG